jgi:hypothetical protein
LPSDFSTLPDASLENALKLLEHIVSKSYPSGYHEYPIDGWSSTDSNINNAPIESQILSEILWDIITQ